MNRAALLIATMTATLLLASGVALAEFRLDQQQTVTGSSFQQVTVDSNEPAAQTFTAGLTGKLERVSVHAGCCRVSSFPVYGGSPPGDMTVGIYAIDGSGLPTGEALGTASVPEWRFSTSGSMNWVDVEPAPAPLVTAGTGYALVVASSEDSPPSPADYNYLWGFTTNSTGSAYPGGRLLFRPANGTWQAFDQADFAFRTFVETDVTAPTITGVTPRPGKTGVFRGTNVSATFSEEMAAISIADPDIMASTTFTLKKKGAATPVAAEVRLDATGKTAILDPSRNLRRGATYVATVTTDAKDLARNSLATARLWKFTVRR